LSAGHEGVGGLLTVSGHCTARENPSESVTVTEYVYVAALAVTVPLTSPAAFAVRPVGNPVTAYVYAGDPADTTVSGVLASATFLVTAIAGVTHCTLMASNTCNGHVLVVVAPDPSVALTVIV